MLKIIVKFRRFYQVSFSKKIQFLFFTLAKIRVLFFYKYLLKSCGKRNVILKPIFWTPENIAIGDDVIIFNGNRIEAVSEYANTVFSPEIIIESNVSLQQYCHITAAGCLVIGAGTSVLQYVVITDIDHEYESLGISPSLQPLSVKKTKIGKNCFIGAGARILAGTTLGEHCIVGANAVVKGHFPAGCVIAGIPAKIIKRYDPMTNSWCAVDKNKE
ncbi:hypothetical protein BSK71_04475 [Pectobacterium actinidiae]|uniref:Acetyltransferase n=1 Tax=Pectobacterium actinidiae TaxID=1507808 RepID=A0A1V2R7T1_9GAMM|nr:acyltransferase [Pectobacterium actinidiae]ONK04618.1 hypothetical protein BSK69_10400 [Pectobacterium actinidiae]ONK08490.1 hypothetical protein BSK71_04475 [Pectobacterium actinidiae]